MAGGCFIFVLSGHDVKCGLLVEPNTGCDNNLPVVARAIQALLSLSPEVHSSRSTSCAQARTIDEAPRMIDWDVAEWAWATSMTWLLHYRPPGWIAPVCEGLDSASVRTFKIQHIIA